MTVPRVFDLEYYAQLNRVRGDSVTQLLEEIRAPFSLQTAIDVGCGLGYFSQLLKSLGFQVVAIDGRQQNVDEAQRRNPHIRFFQVDAEDATMVSLGKFDLVFCFGLLYHLENPMSTVRRLKDMTGKLLLVEAVVYPSDETIMAFIEESPYEDQGLNHIAFYPTETCLLKMLYRAGFNHVYTFVTLPDHLDYISRHRKPRIRTMLAASHTPVNSKALVRAQEPESPIHPCTLATLNAGDGAVGKIKRFAKKPLGEQVEVIKHIVKGRSDR